MAWKKLKSIVKEKNEQLTQFVVQASEFERGKDSYP